MMVVVVIAVIAVIRITVIDVGKTSICSMRPKNFFTHLMDVKIVNIVQKSTKIYKTTIIFYILFY